MNCQVEEYKSYSNPTFAGSFRLLIGMILMFIGIYLAIFTDIQGHGLGFLLIFASPFLVLKDAK